MIPIYLVVTMSTKVQRSKTYKNKTTIDHNDDLFKHVRIYYVNKDKFKTKAIVFNIMGCLTASEYYKHYSFYYMRIINFIKIQPIKNTSNRTNTGIT